MGAHRRPQTPARGTEKESRPQYALDKSPYQEHKNSISGWYTLNRKKVVHFKPQNDTFQPSSSVDAPLGVVHHVWFALVGLLCVFNSDSLLPDFSCPIIYDEE